ncbi:replication restart DNA helicase PriA [Fluviicoccus keumensis]|uniref:Replication restart protein PriA n=1 Tax=Fluviicoccus keumensis TaxID=1435465 RepID=A0A4Q7ZEA4_9GAMM|nr:primosomal protein N' [Fluviicoccus keumensis]RZU48269.1 replication restart DNA helicase PriA [Fluviicoccus keumensis]
MSRHFLQVALPVPLRKTFDYRIPATFSELPALGARVKVPFGPRDLIGIVTGISDHTDTPEDKLKFAKALLDPVAVFPEPVMELLLRAARYYHYPVGEVFDTALPALLRQGDDLFENPIHWRLTHSGRALDRHALRNAPKQLIAWDGLLLHGEHGISEDFLTHMGIGRDSLNALARKGLAESFGETRQSFTHPRFQLSEAPLVANAEQTAAIEAITGKLGHFQPFLLEGITGSGKTEVYLQAVEACLRRHQQVLILVPEIGLTPQIVSRFRARFATDIALLHSGLTERERLKAWRRAFLGHAGIVIGTRSSLFTPMPHLGLIIVDEEHDLSFKQQEGFRYHARDLAVMRGQLQGCPVVLGSATPSLETLGNARSGRYEHLVLQERAASAQAPDIKLIDLRGQKLRGGLTDALHRAIALRLNHDEQVLVFINRRGFAPVLLCHDCGWQAVCPRCDARTTLHRDPVRLHCHHCGYSERPPKQCPSCQSEELRAIGAGTVRVEESLKELFPKADVHRIDRDSTRRKDSWQNLYDQVAKGNAAILVGTQMLAKGHHFPNVTLVALLEADSGLLGADFRAGERVAQLITQVAGRAGRAHKAGLVLLQTHQPDHALLKQLLNGGYSAFADVALEERRQIGLPPYGHLALLRAEANAPELALQFLQEAVTQGQALGNEPEFWGPIPAPMEKKAGVYRAHLLLKSGNRPALHHFLDGWLPLLPNLPTAKRIRWTLDVDPQETA